MLLTSIVVLLAFAWLITDGLRGFSVSAIQNHSGSPAGLEIELPAIDHTPQNILFSRDVRQGRIS